MQGKLASTLHLLTLQKKPGEESSPVILILQVRSELGSRPRAHKYANNSKWHYLEDYHNLDLQ